jgi:predicted TIM-barrel fold metal-dependent hydrolase
VTDRDGIVDSHIHLFLATPLSHPEQWPSGLSSEEQRLMRERFERNMKERGQPPMDLSLKTPAEYAGRWIEEFDRNGIEAGIFLSLQEDPEPMREFVAAAPDRFFGFAFVDPKDPAAPGRLDCQIRECGFRGLKLIATNQSFRASDREVYPLWEKATELGIPVLIHYGVSIGYNADLRYANPLDLQPVLRDFPDLNFILAHFGTGFFRESLMLCYQAENIYLDTSSSNIWIRYQGYPLTLEEVFGLALEAAGPRRVIFGTDSSYFPRGFRRDILDEQTGILDRLGLGEEDRRLVMGGNIRRLTGLPAIGGSSP